ncbi:hypothetical protein BX600DRAFT_279921 [Xylariales sp. PMI_506]|nr:hypothetical protein BX600DRAFT_279921 [Xylariales sp. PMI_506]
MERRDANLPDASGKARRWRSRVPFAAVGERAPGALARKRPDTEGNLAAIQLAVSSTTALEFKAGECRMKIGKRQKKNNTGQRRRARREEDEGKERAPGKRKPPVSVSSSDRGQSIVERESLAYIGGTTGEASSPSLSASFVLGPPPGPPIGDNNLTSGLQ